MTTLEREIRLYRPAIALDALISRRARRNIFVLMLLVLIVLGGVIVAYLYVGWQKSGEFDTSILLTDARPFTGLLAIFLGPFIILFSMMCYYSTLYFRGVRMVTREDLQDGGGITLEVAKVLDGATDDLTATFLLSPYGSDIVLRSGISPELIPSFLSSNRTRIPPLSLPLAEGEFTTLLHVGTYLVKADTAFRDFLFKNGVTEELFNGACAWMSRVRAVRRYTMRWWSRDNLGKREGIGREFSYGVAYELSKYMRDIRTTSVLSVMLSDIGYANEVIERIETILTRSKAANVILVGEPGAGEMDMLIELGRRMREGKSLASLEGKRLVVFDTNAFVATHTTKEEFEAAFLTLMTEAERAGNIIIVIENLPAFISSVTALGSDVSELMNRFLASPYIQIVSTAEPSAFHAELETHHALLRNFTEIPVETPDLGSTIRVLEEAAWAHERRYGIVFTYGAIVRVATCADQYIVDGVMPDKALNLLSEVASLGGHEHVTLITDTYVDTKVSESLNVPVGPIQSGERDMLLNLEAELHKRVVGQDEAVRAIAGTMRRARAGIGSTKRPIGSFLFLGSTGVGKTETAKALAALFFGSDEKMVRFDMSEFSGTEGLPRLLGTATSPGALASALHEHPYCVLLLDEFEKADSEVHDLFLQILDEGMFTDARGTRVNARNTIVIATSNAGSARIWAIAQSGKRPHDVRDEIIDEIIGQGIFRPELINRFDATIMFSSLAPDEQRVIARNMLRDLESRIKDRGYTLVVNDALIDAVMREGYDPEFGARPMRRAIQDVIEERVATKIIEGNLRPGASIELTPAELA
jgi:ATP-dependent Clp protease ATP-binding subunit ClpC